MEILNNGIWVGSDAGKHHQFDEQLSHAIANLFKFNDIIAEIVERPCLFSLNVYLLTAGIYGRLSKQLFYYFY